MSRTPILPNIIIELLTKNHLLSVTQILELLEKNQTQFNKTSVYRALDKLLSEEKVCKQSFGGGEFVYELRAHHHDHAICNKCEKIIAIECDNHEHKEISGFKISHHHKTLYGLCNNC